MTEHRRTLKRYEGLGDIRYLTCSCYRRLPLFQNDKIKDAFTTYLGKSRDRLAFNLYAWVVMPEHLHILLKPAPRQDVSQVLRGIKAGFAKTTIERWRELDAPILGRITDSSGRARFWQTGGGYDRNVFTEKQLVQKIGYIHHNPVRRGLVDRPGDWLWSSERHYEPDDSYEGPTIDWLV